MVSLGGELRIVVPPEVGKGCSKELRGVFLLVESLQISNFPCNFPCFLPLNPSVFLFFMSFSNIAMV